MISVKNYELSEDENPRPYKIIKMEKCDVQMALKSKKVWSVFNIPFYTTYCYC